MITNYKIFEAKQIGLLYHWTDFVSLINIIKNNSMGSWRGYVSFSRNTNLNYNNLPIKIIFDGDKMSNHFRFEPHLYLGDRNFKRECEERIKCTSFDDSIVDNPIKNKFIYTNKFNSIKNIKKYIIGIEIDCYKTRLTNAEIKKYIDEIKKYINITPNIISSLTDAEIKKYIDEIKKYIKIKITESKQVGLLYHWTDIDSLEKILTEDRMVGHMNYISLSRNKNLNFNGRQVRITFDGDKMSNKFKFEPHLYMKDLKYKEESEERIPCTDFSEPETEYTKHNRGWENIIKGVKKYMVDIYIDFEGCIFENTEENEKLLKRLQKLSPVQITTNIDELKMAGLWNKNYQFLKNAEQLFVESQM
jgi:hypothetical protein